MRSPLFLVPADGRATVRLRYWLGLSRDATGRDGLRVHLVDGAGTRVATLLAVSGSGQRREPAWRTLKAPVPPGLAGQAVAIELAAVDAKADSTVEVGVDEVRVTARLKGEGQSDGRGTRSVVVFIGGRVCRRTAQWTIGHPPQGRLRPPLPRPVAARAVAGDDRASGPAGSTGDIRPLWLPMAHCAVRCTQGRRPGCRADGA